LVEGATTIAVRLRTPPQGDELVAGISRVSWDSFRIRCKAPPLSVFGLVSQEHDIHRSKQAAFSNSIPV